MLLLKNVVVNKYKSIQDKQSVDIEADVTTLVGMNEAGKTAFLEALAKFNYFEDDEKFKFKPTLDYPRRELKKYQKSEDDVEVVTCTFTITQKLLDKIAEDLGEGVFDKTTFEKTIFYEKNSTIGGVDADTMKFLEQMLPTYPVEEHEKELLKKINNLKDIKDIQLEEKSEHFQDLINDIHSKIINNSVSSWSDPLSSYVYFKWLSPNIPKLWYYDEYFNLPSRINLTHVKSGQLNDESSKTAKALLEVSQVDLDDLLSAGDFETFIAELEATSNEITDQMFHYWTANNNLEIEFKIDTLANTEKVLDIRIKNQKHRVSIPLNQRSKGFNWFFSFIVWFSKIKNEKNKNYILLLDEPGLNLHASAQGDLLRFIEDLSEDYQVIYTTHSPFMVDSTKLHRVRTVYEGEDGTTISDSIQEKDSRTLFPLQAALGYEIAQNLFVAQNNLLVEGPADLIYLTKMSEILKSDGRTGLNDDIVIAPVGGLDKVPAFISLMTGNKLNMVALLDSFSSPKGKQRLDDMVSRKIIKEKNIRFFDEFTSGKEKADVEDLFTVAEYLKYFRAAYPHEAIDTSEIKNKNGQILPQINQVIKKNRFNHYLPAKEFLKINLSIKSFSKTTIENFEKLFDTINNLFTNS
ncbi:AAA family ATPase [Fictibacillus phosphorivorans]|uniref:AAA family ATPase n=1 Tax=Fictibacillus phosphorivorans TaxID=1221500 RepID=UPI003CEA3222